MAKEYENILVVCADRDNDLGKKADVAGPVVGRRENLNAAAKLALADPEDSDVNSIFAAIKKYDELKPKFKEVEIVTLTGESKLGFESDRKINAQLDSVVEKFKTDGIVFVTDGAEDDQIVPILQSRAPIISKQTVIVKQANQVESTYYTLKEALNDPEIARIVFLVPGLVILLWGAMYLLNYERFFYQAISLVVGVYLILKGTGVENMIASNVKNVFSSFSLQRVSFPFYMLTAFITIAWVYSVYITLTSTYFTTMTEQVITAVEQTINLIGLAGLGFAIAKGIDCIQMKRAIYLRNYFLYGCATVVIWYLMNSGLKVIAGEPYADLQWFLGNVLICFACALLAYKISDVLDVTRRATKILVGLPVYNKEGRVIGKVQEVDQQNRLVKYKEYKSEAVHDMREGKFVMKKGRVLIFQ